MQLNVYRKDYTQWYYTLKNNMFSITTTYDEDSYLERIVSYKDVRNDVLQMHDTYYAMVSFRNFDLWGKYRMQSHEGNKYYIMFKDHGNLCLSCVSNILLHDYIDGVKTLYYTSVYTSFNERQICIYVHEDAAVILWIDYWNLQEFRVRDYIDPYAEDKVIEGTIENVLQMPRVLKHKNKSYVRITIPSTIRYVLCSHEIFCEIQVIVLQN